MPRAVLRGGPRHGDTSKNIAVRSSSAARDTGEPSFGSASCFSRRGEIDWRWRLDADEPMANPRHETYCRERVAGKTQRQAMLAA